MKMNFKSMMIAALAMTTMFAACSKDEGANNNQNGDERTVQIQINRTETRSVGAQVPNNDPVKFTSGYLLFANGADAVTMVVTINTGSATYNSTAKTVGVEALEATGGEWITAVPGQSAKVYFIGNSPVTPAVGNDVKTLSATVSSQWKSDGSVDNVTLYGGAALTKMTTGTGTGSGGAITDEDYEATFSVSPIVARFEIGAISGDTDITDFQVDGIFFDNYYDAMYINGTAITTAGNLKLNGSTVAKYATDGTGGSYTTAMAGSVYDYAAAGLTAPTAGNAWAYNLLAPTSASPAMPALVIRLSGVEVNSVAWPGDYFLTVQNFYEDPAGTPVKITQLEQRQVYVISDLEFTADDLTTEPYLKTKNVRVKINMLTWESNEVGYDFD